MFLLVVYMLLDDFGFMGLCVFVFCFFCIVLLVLVVIFFSFWWCISFIVWFYFEGLIVGCGWLAEVDDDFFLLLWVICFFFCF